MWKILPIFVLSIGTKTNLKNIKMKTIKLLYKNEATIEQGLIFFACVVTSILIPVVLFGRF